MKRLRGKKSEISRLNGKLTKQFLYDDNKKEINLQPDNFMRSSWQSYIGGGGVVNANIIINQN